jgi:hypothetical protein
MNPSTPTWSKSSGPNRSYLKVKQTSSNPWNKSYEDYLVGLDTKADWARPIEPLDALEQLAVAQMVKANDQAALL